MLTCYQLGYFNDPCILFTFIEHFLECPRTEEKKVNAKRDK